MKVRTLVLLIPCTLLFACGRKEPPPPDVPEPVAPAATTTVPAPTGTATAALVAAANSPIKGNLRLTASETGVSIEGEITGLPAGEHGFHVHEKGECTPPDFKTAGEHLNPNRADHGGASTSTHHLGDIPNIVADASGHAAISANISGATLRDGGTGDLIGKAFIVHAKADDYVTQPSGNAGDRIACGVVK
jgi:superoxide dismutase, Cu-Zn family